MAVVAETRERSLAPAAPPWTAVLHDWVTTVDHKKIGIMYVLMAVVFLVIAGIEAILIRWQLFWPRNDFIGPDTFNRTVHDARHHDGLLHGHADPDRHRQLPGAAHDRGPGHGLSAAERLGLLGDAVRRPARLFQLRDRRRPGHRLVRLCAADRARPSPAAAATDFWALGLIVSGIGTLDGGRQLHRHHPRHARPRHGAAQGPLLRLDDALDLGADSLRHSAVDRRPGHGLARPQTGRPLLRRAERRLGATLWQHLFWFFGHPEVYILILPAFGMISEIIPVFSRKVLFGYEFMAAATAAIAFISLGVWAHHMFAVGMSRDRGPLLRRVQPASISIPTGIKFFNWLATMYGGRISFASPMLFCARVPVDVPDRRPDGHHAGARPRSIFSCTDSYFVVGHFHWVLIGGTLFGVFAGIHYWYPKVTGRMLSERLARWQFWLLYIGFILTFGPMHIAGMLGMPRRIYTYDADRGWAFWNQLTTIGAIIQAAELRHLCRQRVRVAAQGQAGGRRSLGRLDAGVVHDLAAAGV